jgi:hypothetical protein
MEGFQAILSAVSLPGNYQRNRQSGQGAVPAVTDAVADAAALTFLSPITYGVTSITKGLAHAAYRGFRNASVNIQSVNTPFSQGFHHNRTTAQLQSFALGRMGAMRGMGNEASRMYGQFGSR